jgi:hypothetical protein
MSAILWKDRRCFNGSSDARDDEIPLLRLWREMRGELEPKELAIVPKEPNRRWYETITGRIPAGLYMVAVCYGTTVILLGSLPWNVLLLLLLLPTRNKRSRFQE